MFDKAVFVNNWLVVLRLVCAIRVWIVLLRKLLRGGQKKIDARCSSNVSLGRRE